MFIEWWVLVLLAIGYIWKIYGLASEIESLRRERWQLREQQRSLEERHADELHELRIRHSNEIGALRHRVESDGEVGDWI